MKKNYTLLFLLFFIAINPEIFSQITYPSANYALPGDSFLMSEAPEALLTGYKFDSAGANISWIFDTLPALTQRWHNEEDPDETGYETAFLTGIPLIYPGCIESCIDTGGGLFACTSDCSKEWDSLTNAVLSLDTINLQAFSIYDIYNFYKNTGNGYEKRLFGYKVDISGLTGALVTVLDNPDVLYKFPLNYGNQDSSESSFTIDLDLGFVYSHWQKRINEVDGWGSLTTPFKSYANTLRVKSMVYAIDLFILDDGTTLDLSSILSDTVIQYKWFDANYGVPVMTVSSVVYNGIEVYVNAEYIDTVRCIDPIPLFGYLPVPTYLNTNTDSVEVNFYNLSMNYDSLHWNFDDPVSGVENESWKKNPSHWFTSQGAYLVELTVCNSSVVCDTPICHTLPLPVVVIDTSAVYANFVYKPLFPCGGDTVFFTNTSVNDTAWFWDFGDGFTSVAENPFHIYGINGTFNVMLVAYKGSVSDTAYKSVKIASTPVVSFIYSDTVTLVPVQFTNTSSGTDMNTGYLWTFGGGKPDIAFSLDENPVVTFDREDSVNVCLLALNSLGCAASACEKFYVTKCLEAKFQLSGLNAYCINQNINCNNQSTTGLTQTVSYEWYSDGVLFATTANTSLSFTTTGEHTITLVAGNGICTDTATKAINLKAPAALYAVGNDTTICLGDTIQLNPSYTTGGQNGDLYNWSPSNGLSASNIPDPKAFPDSTTRYVFTFSVIGGACNLLFSAKDSLTINVDTCLVGEKVSLVPDSRFQVYPNPAHDEIVISPPVHETHNPVLNIAISDVLGKTLIARNISFSGNDRKQVSLKIDSFDAGIYLIKLSDGNGGFWTTRFAKQ